MRDASRYVTLGRRDPAGENDLRFEGRHRDGGGLEGLVRAAVIEARARAVLLVIRLGRRLGLRGPVMLVPAGRGLGGVTGVRALRTRPIVTGARRGAEQPPRTPENEECCRQDGVEPGDAPSHQA